MSPKAKVKVILVDEKRCKGCGICIALCPKQVLALKKQKCRVEHLEVCIGCDLCQLRCPDFAIEVVHEDKDSGQGGADHDG